MTRTALAARAVTLRYHETPVVRDASVELRPGRVTALVGPNGSGKSTLLRGLARLHRPHQGAVVLDSDVDSALLSARDFARRVTMLSQSRPDPSGLLVSDVVAFGRHPYRRRFGGSPSEEDLLAIGWALGVTGTTEMGDRPVDELSGGEVQRVWLATCLAQQTGVLLLDEPTNHLDLRYQVETLDLVRDLADDHGVALGVVLHDLNHAAIVADDVALMDRGHVRATGTPAEVLSSDLLSDVYGIPVAAVRDPETGVVRTEARGRRHRAASADRQPSA